MKTRIFENALVLAVTLALPALNSPAQDSTPTPDAQQLPYGASQILQLQQAQVGDDTIVQYIKNSGNGYQLDASQIIYLKQQGVSGTVLSTMLQQPKPGVLPATVSAAPPASQATDAAQPSAASPPASAYVSTVMAQPVGSVTILPAIHAAAPPTYCYPQRAGFFVQTGPVCYPVCNYYRGCASMGFVSAGSVRGCSVGGFHSYGGSYSSGLHGGKWHH